MWIKEGKLQKTWETKKEGNMSKREKKNMERKINVIKQEMQE